MRVFIAEKPSQARELAQILGCHRRGDGFLANDNDVVTWAFGHLLQPADPERYDEKYKKWVLNDLPIMPERWKLDPNPKSKKQLSVIKGLLSKASEVVVATDSDREGELVGRLILGNARYKGPTKRLWLSSLDETSIKKALASLKDITETDNFFWSGLGRQRADWMAGMSYTRAATLLFGAHGDVCSVGRVQSPTLRLVVERDLEIEAFVSKPFYVVTAQFSQGAKSLNCEWVVPEHAKGDEEGRCLDKEIAKKVKDKCQFQQGELVVYKTEEKQKNAPLPFSLSELQKKANTQYGYSAKEVLVTAQSLYEKHKVISYPRSDCPYLPISQFADAKGMFLFLDRALPHYKDTLSLCDSNFRSRCWNDVKVEQASHHALIPILNPKADFSQLNGMEANIYDLIARQYLAQFAGNYVYKETVIEIDCEGERFRTKGIVPINLGWKALPNKGVNEQDEAEKELPELIRNMHLENVGVDVLNKTTTPPHHYTDATLLSAMKNCGRKVDDENYKKILLQGEGIGTDGTRADIIEVLKKRNYVTQKGKYIISTGKGRGMIKQLPDGLTNVLITAKWEQVLKDVEQGKASYDQFIGGIKQELVKNIAALREMEGKCSQVSCSSTKYSCPVCGKEMIRRKSKKGKGYWWGCSGYKTGCLNVMDDLNGKPIAKTESETSKIDCPTCKKSKLVKRQGKKGNAFWGCLGYPTCKAIYSDKNGHPQLDDTDKTKPEKANKLCSKCGSEMYIRVGKKGKFLGCSSYPKCKNIESYEAEGRSDDAI